MMPCAASTDLNIWFSCVSLRVQVDNSMRMLVRLVFGLFVLKAVVAGPRFSRQVDAYDNYDVDLDNLNLETYEYEDGLTIDDPQVSNRLGREKVFVPCLWLHIYEWSLQRGSL